MVTLGGVDTVADVEIHPMATVSPPAGAAPERLTVHCEEPGAVTEVGLQERLFRGAGGLAMVTVAPEPMAGTGCAVADVASAASTWMALEVDVVVLDTAKVAVPIVPSAMPLAFKPLAMQMY